MLFKGRSTVVCAFRWGIDPTPDWFRKIKVSTAAEDHLSKGDIVYRDTVTDELAFSNPATFYRIFEPFPATT